MGKKERMDQRICGNDPTNMWHHSRFTFLKKKKKKEKSVSQLSCTQFIIQQKEKHNTLRTEDGKIPHGDKVGGKTNLRRHLKAKQTGLLFVWISQLTGMLCDQFLMMNMFKRCRTGRAGHAFCMLASPRKSQGRRELADDVSTEPWSKWNWERFWCGALRRIRETVWHPFINPQIIPSYRKLGVKNGSALFRRCGVRPPTSAWQGPRAFTLQTWLYI